MSYTDEILSRLSEMPPEEGQKYAASAAALGIAYLIGAKGEKWTREFVDAPFLAAGAHGSDVFTHPNGGRIALPREPNGN